MAEIWFSRQPPRMLAGGSGGYWASSAIDGGTWDVTVGAMAVGGVGGLGGG